MVASKLHFFRKAQDQGELQTGGFVLEITLASLAALPEAGPQAGLRAEAKGVRHVATAPEASHNRTAFESKPHNNFVSTKNKFYGAVKSLSEFQQQLPRSNELLP